MIDSERHRFEVMLEQIIHEVKTVSEGYNVLDEKIERFHKEAKEDHRLSMDLIKYSNEELKREIRGVREELTKEIQKVDENSKKRDTALMTEIQKVDENSKKRDTALMTEMRSFGEKVDGHEARISELETKVA
ncbi:MAG TPA: hypothetical protein ENH24_03405 [Nitrospirae bacterium]|nr:hypothetical protein [Nitrospirota bacterium]